MYIEIMVFGDVEKNIVKILSGEIKRKFGIKCKYGRRYDVPPEAYSKIRGQYLGDFLLEYASRLNGRGKVLALTDVDLYTRGVNFIFGLAKMNGNSCIVSLHRLREEFYGRRSDYDLLLERTIKEAFHELGHVFGLRHCPDFSCVMRFSKNICEVDMKSMDFCENHEKRLFNSIKIYSRH